MARRCARDAVRRALVRARLCLAVVAGVLVAGAPRALLADDRTAFLIDRLKYPPSPGQSDDFRVRFQAAIQLGRTGDEVALQPLCAALSDPNETVRGAVAAGLLRLGKPGATPCLKDRLAVETSDAAKAQIQKAIDGLAGAGGGGGGGGGGSGALANNPGAHYYIALSHITNNTGRPDAQIDAVVIKAIQDKMTSLGNCQLAPPGESADQARAAMSGRHMKGYYFSIAVDAFDYSGGNLRVKVKLTIFNYPSKSMLGDIPTGLSQSGTSPGDTAAEDALMTIAATNGVAAFAQNFP